jgi:hypothetical protein
VLPRLPAKKGDPIGAWLCVREKTNSHYAAEVYAAPSAQGISLFPVTELWPLGFGGTI